MSTQLTLISMEGEESTKDFDASDASSVSMEDLKSLILPFTRDDIERIDFDGSDLTLDLPDGELVINDFLNEFGDIKEIYTVNGQLLFKDASDLISQLSAPAAGNTGVDGNSSIFGFLDDFRPFFAGDALGYRDLRGPLADPDIVFPDLDGDPDVPSITIFPNAQADTLSFGEDEFGDEQGLPGGNLLANDTAPVGSSLIVVAVNGIPLIDGSITIILPSGAEVQVNEDGSYQVLNPEIYESLGLGEGDTANETFTYTASDGAFTDSATVTISVDGANDLPTLGGDDTGDVTEDFEVEVIDEVEFLTEDGVLTVSDPDSGESFFDPDSVVSAAGNLGSLNIDANGNWNYSVENQIPDIQNLLTGQSLSDTFTVSTVDGTTQEIVITINGFTDGVPSITIDDSNGEETAGDISVAENSSVSSSFDIEAAEGIDTVLIGSTLVTIDQLLDLENGVIDSIDITGETFGDMQLTGFSSVQGADSDTIQGTISYSYDPTGSSVDHSGGDIIETISMTLTDKAAQSSNEQLDINITDTAPEAVDDEIEVSENNSGNVIGNVLDNDIDSADTPLSFEGWDNAQVSAIQALEYVNDFTVNGDGSYSFSIDHTHPTVHGLEDGDEIVLSVNYQVADSDGVPSPDTGALIFTIKGISDGDPEIHIDDKNGVASGDVSVAEDQVLSDGSFDIILATDLETIKIGDTTITKSELEASSTTNIIVAGTAFGTLTITGFDGTAISYTYDPTGDSQDHSGGIEILESVGITVTETGGGIASDDLDILIEDTSPQAVDDDAEINEENTGSVGGNVLANDIESADLPLVFDGWNSAQVSAIQALEYVDDFTANGDGTYSFSIVNTHPTIEGLDDGDEIVLTVDYEVTDGDGASGSDTGTLTFTIKGSTDGDPEIDIEDKNGDASGDASVDEDQVLADGSFDINLVTDLDTIKIGNTTITKAQLEASATSNIVVTGTLYGTLTIIGFDGTTISYTYDPTGTSQDHSGGEILETIGITVTETGNGTASDNLEILIEDTKPVAMDDPVDIAEGEVSINGNVLDNDIQSADQPSTAEWGATTAQYGTLTVSANGTYTYELDNGNYDVITLGDGDILTETFSYMIKDSDGSTSPAELTITINGASDDGSCPDLDADNVYMFSGTGVFEPIDGGDGFDILLVDDTTLNFDDKPRQFDNFERLHLCGKNNNHQSQTLQQINPEDIIDMTSDSGPFANTLMITGDPIDPDKPNASPGDTVKLDLSPTEWIMQDNIETFDGMEFNVYTNDGATLWIETELNVDDIS